MFDSRELELVVCGLPTIDVADWKLHTLYLGEYTLEAGNHPVVRWFWELVESMSESNRAKLLQV